MVEFGILFLKTGVDSPVSIHSLTIIVPLIINVSQGIMLLSSGISYKSPGTRLVEFSLISIFLLF